MKNKQLFNKAICFGDIHFGLKHNSPEHNQDCIDFINWMIAEGKSRDVETCIFLGDFQHHRNQINSHTLDYMINAVKLLNDNFKKIYFIVGNHDMYWREKRDISSTKFASLFPNVVFIDQMYAEGDVTLVPWLVNDEWKGISKLKTKYIFGHFELPGFKMNASIELPDHGQLNATHFVNQTYVFSGHFHSRQTKGKISYIGNPFGHNYSDIWDFDRGAMFLEWDKEPEYLNYDDGPKYMSVNLSSLLDNQDIYLKKNAHLQVIVDLNITYEEASFLRENFISTYNVREFRLVRPQVEDEEYNFSGDVGLKTVDEIVVEQLLVVDKGTCNPTKLIEIYNNL